MTRGGGDGIARVTKVAGRAPRDINHVRDAKGMVDASRVDELDEWGGLLLLCAIAGGHAGSRRRLPHA